MTITKKTFGILYAALGIACLTFFVLKGVRDKTAIKEDPRYVIGLTNGWSHNIKSSNFAIDYIYQVRGIKYRSVYFVSSLSGIQTSKGRYIVKFENGRPGNSTLILDMKIPGNSGYVVDTGWITVPWDITVH